MRSSVDQTLHHSLLTALGNPRGHRLLLLAPCPSRVVNALAGCYEHIDVFFLCRDVQNDIATPESPRNVAHLSWPSEQGLSANVRYDAALFLAVLSVVANPRTMIEMALQYVTDRGRIMAVEPNLHARSAAQQNAVALCEWFRQAAGSTHGDRIPWASSQEIGEFLRGFGIRHVRITEMDSACPLFPVDSFSADPATITKYPDAQFPRSLPCRGRAANVTKSTLHKIKEQISRDGIEPLDCFIIHGILKTAPPHRALSNKGDSDTSASVTASSGLQQHSLTELLSLVMTGGESAERMKTLAGRVLHEYGSRAVAEERDPQRLAHALDISLERATQILALFEIARRFYSLPDEDQAIIRGPEDIVAYAKGMAHLQCEQLRLLCLNEKSRVIADHVVAEGTESCADLHAPPILRVALQRGATSIALVHNHPSGDPTPSAEDIEATRRLNRSTEIVGVPFLDHVIIGHDQWHSMRLSGTL